MDLEPRQISCAATPGAPCLASVFGLAPICALYSARPCQWTQSQCYLDRWMHLCTQHTLHLHFERRKPCHDGVKPAARPRASHRKASTLLDDWDRRCVTLHSIAEPSAPWRCSNGTHACLYSWMSALHKGDGSESCGTTRQERSEQGRRCWNHECRRDRGLGQGWIHL